jgi:prolipoprotein diacylglyceryl transferase
MILGYMTWSADPVLFSIGSASVRWYSFLLVLSIYISYLFLKRMFIKEGVSTDILFSYGLFIIGGLIIGGRLVHCLAYEPEYYLKYPWDIIKPWRGELGKNAVFVGYRGISGHGSAIGIVVGIVLNSLRTKTSIIWMVDRIALFGPLIGFFVRIGNFFNSEILGKATDTPIGIVMTRADQVPRHPVQLYEALAYIMIFVFCYRYYQRRVEKEKPGEFLGLVLVLVYTARFLLEFFKAKQSDVETSLALNMGHLLSIPFIITGLVLLIRPFSKKYQPKLKRSDQ